MHTNVKNTDSYYISANFLTNQSLTYNLNLFHKCLKLPLFAEDCTGTNKLQLPAPCKLTL